MLDYYRVRRGIILDEGVSIIQGTDAPAVTAGTDADTALVGSLYLDALNGSVYTKKTTGIGTGHWLCISNPDVNTQLYTESVTTFSAPVASGANSIALGDAAATSPNAHNAIALGSQALARTPGSQIFANGRFTTSGDAQAGRYLLRGVTVNAAESELFIDGTGMAGGTERLVLPDDATWTFKATITGHRVDVSDGHAGFTLEGVVYRVNGLATISLVGQPTINVITRTDSAWGVKCYADTTNGSLKLTVKGQTSKVIRWLACIDTVEITN